MSAKLLTEHHLEFLSLKEGFTGLSESTHVKMPHCWKSHATAHLVILVNAYNEFTYYVHCTVNVLKFHKMPGQTAQTQIRLLLKKQSDLGLRCLLF